MTEMQLKGDHEKIAKQLAVPTAAFASQASRPQLGIILCLLSMLIFAGQDGVTKVLVKDLPVAQLVMVRYWVFVIFALSKRRRSLDDAIKWRG